MTGIRTLGIVVGAAVVAAALLAAPASAQTVASPTFTNSTAITFPVGGAATPYPSSILVSGLPDVIYQVRVTINNYSAIAPASQDVDLLLVGPAATTSARASLPMSDVCTGSNTGTKTWTFTDAAAATLPNTSCLSVPSGSYKPSDFFADAFPPPAPPGPYPQETLNSFGIYDNRSPNGTWSLYGFDDNGANGGSASISGGWSISFDIGPLLCEEIQEDDSCLEGAISKSCLGLKTTRPSSSENETIVGTNGNDVIDARSGNDIVRGLGGADVLCGGDGNDKLVGGPGKDKLLGQGGKDKLRGGRGKDRCVGGPAKDRASACEREKSL